MAVEYLDHKNVFGRSASIEEMQKFKSKVKKQTPVYDPDLEREKEQKEAEERRQKEKEEKFRKEMDVEIED